jgi:hypothetical protein
MHDPEICSLDGVVGVKGVRDPMLAVVVCTPSYLNFISYAVTPTSFRTIGLDRRRRSFCVVLDSERHFPEHWQHWLRCWRRYQRR